MRNKIILLLAVALGIRVSSHAQYQVYTSLEKYDTLYAFANQDNKGRAVNLHFPAYDMYEKDLSTGYRLKLKKAAGGKEQYVALKVPAGLPFEPGYTFYQRVHTVNVKSFSVYLYNGGASKWMSLEYNVEKDGYQIPYHVNLAEWKEGAFAAGKADPSTAYLVCRPADARKTVTFTAGAFAIGRQYLSDVAVSHNFFKGIACGEEAPPQTRPQKPGILLSQFSVPPDLDYLTFPLPAQLKIKHTGPSGVREPELLYQLMKKVFQHYLFYQETGIDQEKAQMAFEARFRERLLAADSLDCNLSKDFSDFLQTTFKDPHFGVTMSSKCEEYQKSRLVRGPIHLYELDKKVRVAAVLDSAYRGRLPLGTELQTINGAAVGPLVDSLQRKLGPWERRADIVSDLLKARRQDSTVLGFKGIKEKITVKYNKKLHVPNNFRLLHCQYKKLENEISYFRVRQWDFTVYFEFIKRWPEIERSKNLILDLRKNGGGEYLSVLRMLTVFVHRPMVHFKTEVSRDAYESLVVTPNPYFNFPKEKNIVILVDSHTACASESFILGMTGLPNVTIMGADKTFGTDASRFDIAFPSGFKFYINCIARKTVFGDDFVVENKGINPDVWVHLQNVEDLEPYQDKVLRSAVHFLKE